LKLTLALTVEKSKSLSIHHFYWYLCHYCAIYVSLGKVFLQAYTVWPSGQLRHSPLLLNFTRSLPLECVIAKFSVG